MSKKLKISKETLKTLSSKLLAQAVGGSDIDDTGWCPAGIGSDPPYMATSDACNGG